MKNMNELCFVVVALISGGDFSIRADQIAGIKVREGRPSEIFLTEGGQRVNIRDGKQAERQWLDCISPDSDNG